MKLIELKNIINNDFEIVIDNKGLMESYSSFFCCESDLERIYKKYGQYEVEKIKSDYDTFDVTIILKD